jgi:hypothetical protein
LLLLQIVVVLCGNRVGTVCLATVCQLQTTANCKLTFGSIDATDIGSQLVDSLHVLVFLYAIKYDSTTGVLVTTKLLAIAFHHPPVVRLT